ncbi:MAG: NADH:flavin oxidoreductase [Desulfobacterales bacterium]|nr:NADH:flavin oxidoreductase [Desulfobacterales bacterium]
MSMLFETAMLGQLEIKNRFIHSATYEGMAAESGEISDNIIKKYTNIAKGEVGLIIPGYMYVTTGGRAFKSQIGIYSDSMIPGLKKLAEAVHQAGSKIVFQIAHAGRQTTQAVAGEIPIGPSGKGRDPLNFVKPKEMTEKDIQDIIQAFCDAAKRAMQAGADGIQIHAAHGYIVNQFLSPFFNQRNDEWGGSDENRFRFIEEVFLGIKNEIGDRAPVIVKLNTHDYTPKQGIIPDLSVKYSGWLAELGVDGIEVSCGTALYSFMNMCRGEVPVDDLVSGLPWWKKPIGRMMMNTLKNKYDLKEGYNLEAAKMIKPVVGDTPISVVGGIRSLPQIEDALEKGYTDFVSMSRPFIRDPFLVKKIKQGDTDTASCVSCNKCLAAAANNKPVRCYHKGQ